MLIDMFDVVVAAFAVAFAVVMICVIIIDGTDWMFEDEEESDARAPDDNTADDI